MSDQSQIQGISNEEREANKRIYVGKRLYSLFVDVQNVLHDAGKQGVEVFDEMDVAGYIEAAREMGQVPEWNKAPVTRKLTYELHKGAGSVAN